MNPSKDFPDKREYTRLKSVFPVEFTVVRLDEALLGLNWEQGYTSNVSRGGICLETTHLNESTLKYLQEGNIHLELQINIPLSRPPIRAIAEVVWFRQIDNKLPNKYLIGLKFHTISAAGLNRILAQARWYRFSSRTVMIVAAGLLCAFLASSYSNYKLRVENKKLVDRFVQVQEQELNAQKTLKNIDKEKGFLSEKIKDFSQDISGRQQRLEDIYKSADKESSSLTEELNARNQEIVLLKQRIADLTQKKIPLQNRYEQLIQTEHRIADRLTVLENKKSSLQDNVLEKMHLWLKNHQSPSTGLILSFEGDVGIIKHWAFTYDQALTANIFLLFDNIKGTQQILNFFSRKLTQPFEGFYNAYYFDSGETAEYVIHCGPNIWVGIAVMQYIDRTGDRRYLNLAKEIADWLIRIQDRDPLGGLKGGPQFTWFSTEHNLDAYAFFSMMHEKTQERKYAIARDKAFSWLKTYAMVPHSENYQSPPINRGRGDATIATDTFAWSLAAIGPEDLTRAGMNPSQIMDFAEKHCAVEVSYQRPSGIILDVNGFDFAKSTHMPRGGLVSPEWTSQMIVSYQMLADYFERKDKTIESSYYREKAQIYLKELTKLVISSPSPRGQGEGCLPYATLANADTGHGWATPLGTDTCSVDGTAYMIMAMKNFNPLMLDLSRKPRTISP